MAVNEPLDVGTIYRSDTRELSPVPDENRAYDNTYQPLNDYVIERENLRQWDNLQRQHSPERPEPGSPVPEAPSPERGNRVAELGHFLEKEHEKDFFAKALQEEPDDFDYTGGVIAEGIKGAYHTIKKFMETGTPESAAQVSLMFGLLGLPMARPGSLGVFGGQQKTYGNRISVGGEPAGHFGGGIGDVNISTAYPNLFTESEKTIAAQKAQAQAGQAGAKNFEELRGIYHLSRRLDEANYLVTKMVQEAEATGRTLTATDKTLIKMRDSLEGQLTKLEKQIANRPQAQQSPEQQQQGKPGQFTSMHKRITGREAPDDIPTITKTKGWPTEAGEYLAQQDIPILGSRIPTPDLVQIIHKKFPDLKPERIAREIETKRIKEIFDALTPPVGKRLNEDTGAPGSSSRAPRHDPDQLRFDFKGPPEEPTRALETVPRKPIYSAQGKRVLVPGKETTEVRKKLRDYRRDLRNKKLDF